MKMMKSLKSVTILLAVTLFLAACSTERAPKYPQDNVYHPETDCHFMYLNGDIPITESPDGYYIQMVNTLFFVDKETLSPLPVCGKPNCKHHHEMDPKKVIDCDAYLDSVDAPFLEYMGGYLYVTVPQKLGEVNSDVVLMRMKPDGTERKVIANLGPNVNECIIHRGYIYYCDKVYSEDMKARYAIYRRALKGGDPELLMAGSSKKGSFNSLQAYGNYFYAVETGGSQLDYDLRCLNLLTGEEIPMLEHPDDVDEHSVFFLNGRLTGGLWHARDQVAQNKPAYYEYYQADLDGKNQKTIDFPIDHEGPFLIVMADGKNYWHMDHLGGGMQELPPFVLQKLDEEGNTIASLPAYEGLNPMFFVPGGEKYAFLIGSSLDDNLDNLTIFAVDKEEKDGILNLHEFISVPNQELYKSIEFDESSEYREIADRG